MTTERDVCHDARVTDHGTVNRANWDERAPAHAASAGYGLERFRADAGHLSDVVRFDLPLLGDVTGLDGVHLQCHIGTDTISLARRYGVASIRARLTRLRLSLRRRRSRQGAQRSSTFATQREPPFENGTIWSYPRLSLVRQSTQRPRSLHQTAKRTIGEKLSSGAGASSSPRTAARARASSAARFLVPRSASSTSASMSRADRRSSSHQNRSRYHHQRRPSRVVTRTGSSSCDVARRAKRRSEQST